MSNGTTEDPRRELLSLRQRQKQLGRGLRLMYEQVLLEPVPTDMVDSLHAAASTEATDNGENGEVAGFRTTG